MPDKCIPREAKDFMLRILKERKERFKSVVSEAYLIGKKLLPELDLTVKELESITYNSSPISLCKEEVAAQMLEGSRATTEEEILENTARLLRGPLPPKGEKKEG